jgi:hypothetical protein
VHQRTIVRHLRSLDSWVPFIICAAALIALVLPIALDRVVGSSSGLIIAIAGLILVLLLGHRNALPLSTAMLALVSIAPLPTAIPRQFSLGGGSIFLSDLLIAIVCILALGHSRTFKSGVRAFLVAIGILIAWVLLGMLNDADMSSIIRDVRGIVGVLVLALGIAISMTMDQRIAVKIFASALVTIMLSSAFAVLFETVTSSGFFSLRDEEATLYTATATEAYGAIRLIPPGGLFTVVCSAVLLGLVLNGMIGGPGYWWLWPAIASGFVVALIGFSRNNLIAIVVVVFVAFVMSPRRRAFSGRLSILLGTVLGVGGLVWLFISVYWTGIADAGRELWIAFDGRVIGGLRPDTISQDASSVWRFRESDAALASILSNPVQGTGLGVAYRDHILGEPFGGDYGLTYLHNSFLWVAVKLGIPLTLLLAVFALRLNWSMWKMRSGQFRVAAHSVLYASIALLPVLYVSPVPFSRGGAITSGALLGLAIYLAAQSRATTGNDQKIAGKQEQLKQLL